MENALAEFVKKKKNYDFIDHIRCIAMMSIVAEHNWGSYNFSPSTSKYWLYILIVQFAKFGTIIFFLLAGFLISEKFSEYTPGQYLKRRFSTTFGPWLFWSLMYILCFIINLRVKARMYHDDRFNLHNILEEVKIVYLFTNYWFIINFMISITLLLIFKKYLYSKVFGGVLLLFTLFYTINVHFEWIDPSHTIAILGFIFFLWLGAQLRKNWALIEARMQTLSYTPIIAITVVTFALSIWEIRVLTIEHSIDAFNTLRISNVLYSLIVFVLLLKIKHFKGIAYLRSRQTTYGIYLIHYIIIIFLIPEILRPYDLQWDTMSAFNFLALKLGTFIVTYFITFGIVIGLSYTPAKRLIGV